MFAPDKPLPPIDIDSIRVFLQEVGKRPVPTPDKEQEWTWQAYRAQQIIDLRNDGKTDEQIAKKLDIDLLELHRRLKLGAYAKKKMIECNLRFVVSIAKRYTHRGLEFQDLIQEGAIGLNRAVEKFDPSKGYKFSTYAYAWIRQGITRSVANNSRAVRLPIHITDKLNKIKATYKELLHELQRHPTNAEVAERMGISLESFRRLQEYRRNTLSLNVVVGKGEDAELGDLLAFPSDTSSSPDLFVEQQAKQKALYQVLGCLPERERQIIEMRYGLLTGKERTLQDIGDEIGLSREGVRQLQTKAMRRLRHQSNCRLLRGLIDA